ncbi:class I SAM-dependent methyltransferase [Solimicrobium silvestre]|uniref:Methyltransferase domain n=1 Tax=Solimicrobium silvestre TaxID=2099400 RepID=A0A2S9H1X6_9BURK|nr:methyltransferase domain-containing protein [Solimicrobium silvestre]PRC93967.1 Methyltransferase domain [Solimicrobium silvestre]
MQKIFNKFFSRKQTTQLTPPISNELQKLAVPASGALEANPFEIGLKDAGHDGWYRVESGELYAGFLIDADDVVVDVGCGDGGSALFCANRGAHVIFADIDPDKVAATTHRLAGTPARCIQGVVSDANPLLLGDGVASKVISMEVLEHVDDTAQFLSELVRIGKPGAQYLITVPDPVAEQLQVGLAPDVYFQKPNHVRIIQRDEFEKMVTDAGLVIESHSYYGFYWSIWWMFFWVCKVDLSNPQHPLLNSWARTWEALSDQPMGDQLRKSMNALMPKTQVIVARKL